MDELEHIVKAHRILGLLALLAAAALALPVHALTPEELQTKLDSRFRGDRTGACVVTALIDKGQVLRAKTCAQPRGDAEPGFDSVFEIGSVTKTMTAFLVAELIGQGKWSLDDPIAKHLPPDTTLPRQGERQILVRDVLTHTSGLPVLPPGFNPRNASDPYADLSESGLLAALGKVQLTRPIGSQFEYSNFAMMVMSSAVARAYGHDYEDALVSRLFVPLKMDSAYVERPRSKRPVAIGHLPSGLPTSDWHIANNLAGVGMVRATLDDMVAYAKAELGQADAALLAPLVLTQQPLRERSGMNWMLLNFQGHDLVAHEGGTGGFSSLVALEPKAQRAVVILADTSLADLGGLALLGSAVLGIDGPPLLPRLAATPSDSLLAAMPGDYELGPMNARVWLDGKRLMAQAEGQAAFELKYDSLGDFYPESFGALLTPQFVGGKVDRAVWRQGGGMMEVTRKGTQTVPSATNPRWKDFAGEYVLMPQFSLRVFEEDGLLKVQGSGQPAIAAEMIGTDTIEIKAVSAVVEFKRDTAGQVGSAVLRQGGQVLEGKRKAQPRSAD
jgi:CubicO group peptidase (beta-lactamase class C family)